MVQPGGGESWRGRKMEVWRNIPPRAQQQKRRAAEQQQIQSVFSRPVHRSPHPTLAPARPHHPPTARVQRFRNDRVRNPLCQVALCTRKSHLSPPPETDLSIPKPLSLRNGAPAFEEFLHSLARSALRQQPKHPVRIAFKWLSFALRGALSAIPSGSLRKNRHFAFISLRLVPVRPPGAAGFCASQSGCTI